MIESFVVGPGGRRLYVDPHDVRAAELVRSGGTFNHATLQVWQAILTRRRWDVVVDVGCNYGEMVLWVDLPEHAQMVAFEPHPQVLPYLRRSLDESGLTVDLREVAVGAVDSEAAFVMDVEWSGRSGLAGPHRTDADHASRPLSCR